VSHQQEADRQTDTHPTPQRSCTLNPIPRLDLSLSLSLLLAPAPLILSLPPACALRFVLCTLLRVSFSVSPSLHRSAESGRLTNQQQPAAVRHTHTQIRIPPEPIQPYSASLASLTCSRSFHPPTSAAKCHRQCNHLFALCCTLPFHCSYSYHYYYYPYFACVHVVSGLASSTTCPALHGAHFASALQRLIPPCCVALAVAAAAAAATVDAVATFPC
jgi:hypothetical protein